MTSQSGLSAGRFSSESVNASATVDPRLFLSNLLKRVANDKNVDGNGILRSIENIAAENFNVLFGGALQTALKTYLESGSTEKDAYKSLVNLSNRVLGIARQEDIAAKLDEHLRPEDPRRQIEFIHYDGLPLAYDWGSNTSTPGESPSPYLVNVKSDVLVVMKDAISDYKASQASVRGKLFDPSALPCAKVRHIIWLKDVLCCIKVKQRANCESTPPPVPQSSSVESHSQKFTSKSASQASVPTSLTSRNTSQAPTPPKISQISAPTNPLKRRNTQSSTGAPPGKYQKVSTGGSAPESVESVESHDDSIQTAHYASVLLSRGPYAAHTLGINIDHDNVQVSWFDRQSTISTEEFNISRDFVLFITMIITFSRFSLADWGTTPELYPINDQINYSLKDSRILQIDMTVKPLCHRVCLHSRGTMVLHGKIQTDTSEENVVVKISHPEKQRVAEEIFIKAGHRSEHKKHFAKIYHDEDLGPPTGDIRASFKLDRGRERQFRMIVFEPLKQITSLRDPKHILRVWLDCLKAHHEMWELGYEHGDISIDNLMYRDAEGAEAFRVVTGVLHDWDLAKSHHHQEALDTDERTGTTPYIALDITEDWDLPFRRKYRHDLESFIWCLLSICLDCDPNQKELNLWCGRHSHSMRLGFLLQMHRRVPCGGFEDLYRSARVFMKWLMIDILRVNLIGQTPEEKSDGEIWDGVCNILRDEFKEGI